MINRALEKRLEVISLEPKCQPLVLSLNVAVMRVLLCLIFDKIQLRRFLSVSEGHIFSGVANIE
jgi:hypothetical protein